MRVFAFYDISMRRLVLPVLAPLPRIGRYSKVTAVAVHPPPQQQSQQRRTMSSWEDRHLWNVALSALSGFWLHLTNENVRNHFQSFVDQKIINQEVLTQNMGGRIQMFALLHGLMDPSLRKYHFDVKEFVDAVGPALQIYHETLLQLMTEATTISPVVTATTNKEREDIVRRNMEKDEEIDDDDAMQRGHQWRIEAERDPMSLAGRFMKMVTDENLKEQYHNAKMIQLFSQMGIPAPMNYVTGSCVVEYVSLLNIKSMEIDDILYEQNEYPKVVANSSSSSGSSSDDDTVTDLPVLTRIQVLYKLTRQFQKRNKNKVKISAQNNTSPTSASESYKAINTDVTASSSSPSTTATSTTTTDTTIGNESDVKVAALDNENRNNSKDNLNENVVSSNHSVKVDATTTSTSSSTTTSTTTTTMSQKPDHDPEIYSETRLGVAILEGWLSGGRYATNTSMNHHHHNDINTTTVRPTPQLRWKVASAKESNYVW